MRLSRDQIREHVARNPGASVAVVAVDLGVHRATVYRALATSATTNGATSATTNGATSATPDPAPPGWALVGVNVAALGQLRERASGAGLADGWYQVEHGQPYRVNGQAVTDLSALEFDTEGEAVVRASGVKYVITRQAIRRGRTVEVHG